MTVDMSSFHLWVILIFSLVIIDSHSSVRSKNSHSLRRTFDTRNQVNSSIEDHVVLSALPLFDQNNTLMVTTGYHQWRHSNKKMSPTGGNSLNKYRKRTVRDDSPGGKACKQTQVQTTQSRKEVDENVEYKSNLYFESCKHRCSKTSYSDTNETHSCYCDQECWLYGDCCIDYYSYCLHIHISSSDDKIITATLGTLQNYSQILQFREHIHWSSLSKCFNLTSVNKHFQIVAKCSSETETLAKFEALHRELTNPLVDNTHYFTGLSQEEIKQRCERKVSEISDEYLLDHTHVALGQGTAVHFYNIFCTICNGISPFQVSLWTTNVTCNSQVFNQSEQNLLFTDNFSLATINNNCTIQNMDKASYQMRLCFSHRQSCSRELTPNKDNTHHATKKYKSQSCCDVNNDLPETLCNRYQYAYKNISSKKVYKNHHCYLCSVHSQSTNNPNLVNNEPSEKWIINITNTCVNKGACSWSFNNNLITFPNIVPILQPGITDDYQYEHLEPPLLIPTFRILFDFQTSLTTVTINETVRTIETKTCPQGQVYVPFLDTCRQVNCMPGTRWLDNKCLPMSPCQEMDTEMNETCHTNKSQVFDYLPFQKASVYVRLNIALQYIFGSLETNDSFLSSTTNIIQADQNQDNKETVYDVLYTTGKPINKIRNKESKGNEIKIKKCLISYERISKLYKISKLKNLWIDEMRIKNKNFSKPNQDSYNEMVSIVSQLITATVNKHLVNHSLIVKTILCSKSICHSDGDSSLKKHSYYYKETTSTPRFMSPKRTSDSDKKKTRQNHCLSYGIHLNNSDDLNDILKATKVMISDIVTAAHDYNFLVPRLELTNRVETICDEQARKSETDIEMEIDGRFVTNTNQLCQSGELVVFTESDVKRSQNGTYIVYFNGHEVELGQFSFSVEFYKDPVTSVGEIDVANISWCQVNISKFQCESMQTMIFNSSDVVFIDGTLVSPKRVETFKHFLINQSTSKTRSISLDDLVQSFVEKFKDEHPMIVNQEHYIRNRNEVIVCTNFTNSTQIVNETVHVDKKFIFMPESKVEIIATCLASVISITCLACTLVVYIVMPFLQNVPGKIVMSLCVAILFAQILFLCCQLPVGIVCVIYASVHHAAWLASSTWLAAMSVDLAVILNCQFNVYFDLSRSGIFKLISAISWGIPFTFAGVCFVLFKTNLVPIGYGENGVCWIGNLRSLLFVFGVPVFINLVVTGVCAIAVIRAIGSSANFRGRSTSKRRKSRKQIITCVSLSLLMGFNWFFYFFAVGVNKTILWTLHIFFNGSQGLYIFLCFIARRSLLSKLVAKFKLANIWSGKLDYVFKTPKASLKKSTSSTTPLSFP